MPVSQDTARPIASTSDRINWVDLFGFLLRLCSVVCIPNLVVLMDTAVFLKWIVGLRCNAEDTPQQATWNRRGQLHESSR